MKASWWKYTLLALFTVGVVACGSDNKTANNNNAATSPYTGTSSAVTSSNFDQFREQVRNGQFVTQQANYEKYYYANIQYSSGGSSNSNCSTVLGFIKWCSSSSNGGTNSGIFDRTSSKYNGTIKHEAGDINAVYEHLKSIVNNASYAQQYSQTAWLVHQGDGSAYIIDVAFPMVANPVAFRPASSGLGYSFFTYEAY